MKYLSFILILNTNIFFHLVYSQTVDELVEVIYQHTILHEEGLDSLKNYSHIQKVHFIKMDGDGEIEEQSKRDYLVKTHSKNISNRELIAALDFKDEEWVDVTENEKNKKPKDAEKAQFSLREMVSPESRVNYKFNLVSDEMVNGAETLHIRVAPIEEDEDKFAGDLWFEKESYALVKAKLSPSDNPTGIESMIMTFSMGKYGEVWLPELIVFEAEVSFLIIFNGKIFSEIMFEDYRFEQVFGDSLFTKPVEAKRRSRIID